MSSNEAVQIPLIGGGTYGVSPTMDEKALHNLAASILSHLGRSYDIKVPGSTGWGGREEVLRRKREQSEEYAAKFEDGPFTLDHEDIAKAWRAGWDACPKPVSFPVR